MARMRDIKADAAKKRAQLLAQFNKMPKGSTVTEFAEQHGVTRARMSLQLCKAKREALGGGKWMRNKIDQAKVKL